MEDHGDIVSGVMSVPLVLTELFAELSREGWHEDLSSTCNTCRSHPFKHPAKPNVLVCLQPGCGHIGENPEQNMKFFTPVMISGPN